MTTLEICAGGIEDCINAQAAGANRIELNSALHLGGLSPSLAVLTQAVKKTDIPIICMVRPRGAGFCYNELEKEVMFEDAKIFLEAGAKGLAFGFLTPEGNMDLDATKKMIELCKEYDADSVVHRAFDCVKNPEETLETLIELGCTRILTSGQGKNIMSGLENLAKWQKQYGKQIEFLGGCGVSLANLTEILEKTGLEQLHGSFKSWAVDPTTTNGEVSYRYSDSGDYDLCHLESMKEAVNILK